MGGERGEWGVGGMGGDGQRERKTALTQGRSSYRAFAARSLARGLGSYLGHMLALGLGR